MWKYFGIAVRPIEYFVAGTTTVSRTINLKMILKLLGKLLLLFPLQLSTHIKILFDKGKWHVNFFLDIVK